jgi:WD40 repeat protein
MANDSSQVVVCIGTSRFYREPRLNTLHTPENNAEAFGGLFGPDDFALHRNRELPVLRQNVEQVFRKLPENSNAVLYYSGRALLDEFGRIYLAAADSELRNVTASALSVEWLLDVADESQAGHLILVLDCTYHDHAGGDVAPPGPGMMLRRIGRRHTVVSTSGVIGVPLERPGNRHGEFTYHLMKAAGACAADPGGGTAAYKWYSRAREAMASGNWPLPEYFGDCAVSLQTGQASARPGHDWKRPSTVARFVRRRIVKSRLRGMQRIAFNPPGTMLACGGNHGEIDILEPAREFDAAGLTGHQSAVLALGYVDSGRKLISADTQGAIFAWDVSRREILHRVQDRGDLKLALCVHPKGGQFATSGAGGRIRVWGVESAREIAAVECGGRTIEAMAYHPESQWIASADAAGCVRLWDVASGSCVARGEFGARANTLCFSRDGTLLACGGADGICLWTVSDFSCRSLRTDAVVLDLTFHPAEPWLLVGCAGGRIEVHSTNPEDAPFRAQSGLPAIECVACHPSGRWFVCGGASDSLEIWEARPNSE